VSWRGTWQTKENNLIRKMKEIQIDKECFESLKKAIGDSIKDKCDYCGKKITKDTFGLLSKDITCCNDLICLVQAVTDGNFTKEEKGCGESFQPWGESEEESWWKCGDEWDGEKLFCPNCKSKVKKK